MGSFLLERHDYEGLRSFLRRNGFTDELDFWRSLSGLSQGTIADHLIHYLRSLGYTGTATDQLRDFLQDQVDFAGQGATLYDLADRFYNGTYPPAGADALLMETGDFLLLEDGGKILLE